MRNRSVGRHFTTARGARTRGPHAIALVREPEALQRDSPEACPPASAVVGRAGMQQQPNVDFTLSANSRDQSVLTARVFNCRGGVLSP